MRQSRPQRRQVPIGVPRVTAGARACQIIAGSRCRWQIARPASSPQRPVGFAIDGHKQIVSTTHPSLTKHGIFSGNVMGTNYHRTEAKQGNFVPGSPILLKREPGNKHDANAVVVLSKGAVSIVGYVNKGKAARLAKPLDSGAEIAAVALDGEGS